MNVYHTRVQYPAGQGFFHVGTFHDALAPVSFLYDCGSRTGAAARDESIRGLRYSEVLGNPQRDLAFVSHLHADHFNGLPILNRAGRMPRTLVLPYLDDIDRLITFATDEDESEDENSQAFIQDVVVNGVPALMQHLDVERVYEVFGSDEPPAELRDAPSDETPLPEEPEAESTISPEPGRDILSLGAGRFALSHAIPFIVSSSIAKQRGITGFWLLKPYVEHPTGDTRKQFLEGLSKSLPKTALGNQTIEQWITQPSNRLALMTKYKGLLRAAYGGAGRLNATSMSLYSGPCDPENVHRQRPFTERQYWERGGAWMGTGDAVLAGDSLDSFLAHYGEVTGLVSTLTSPHHGSKENSGNELYTALSPDSVVIAASPRSTYKHPDQPVVHAIANAGARLIVVNESIQSLFRESLYVRL